MARKKASGSSEALALNRVFLPMSLVWTLLIAFFFVTDYRGHQNTQYMVALAGARDAFSRDLVYRQWATGHGGVYVPIDSDTPPNPYLADLPERDIVTPSGRKLTLMNPAYMTRQVHELGFKQLGIRGHITSLKPIRPENAPDEWEKKSLQSFEGNGVKEAASLEPIGKELYLRFMRPLTVTEGCLRCHAKQGYSVGEIRGGICVSLPWEPYRKASLGQDRSSVLDYSALWLVGLGGLGFARSRLLKTQTELRRVGESLQIAFKENQNLLQELQHRAKNTFGMISSLINLSSRVDASPETKAALEELDARVASISGLYSLLHSSGSFTEVRLDEYCVGVTSSMAGLSKRISLATDLESLTVPVNIASPVGLIITELITNALKYAFPEGRSGSISVSLKKTAAGAILEVRDDGIGLPKGFDPIGDAGTGFKLIRGLTNQIGGRLDIRAASPGTAFSVDFPLQ